MESFKELDNSDVTEDSFAVEKKTQKTMYVAESEEADTNDEKTYHEETISVGSSTSSSDEEAGSTMTWEESMYIYLNSSAEEEAGKRGLCQLKNTGAKAALLKSSSDEEEATPKAITHKGSKSQRKYVRLDNSILVQEEKTEKVLSLKDTSAKIDHVNKFNKSQNINDDEQGDSVSDDNEAETDDEANFPDEDEMMMSKSTRLSITGVKPKDYGSDDSDIFDFSNESNRPSIAPDKIPEAGRSNNKTPAKSPEPEASPVLVPRRRTQEDSVVHRVSSPLVRTKRRMMVYDSETDVSKNEASPEVVPQRRSQDDLARQSSSPFATAKDKQWSLLKPANTPGRLASNSHPNAAAGVMYVKKHVRENELSKLSVLQADLQSVRNLLENMDVVTLPGEGVELIDRLSRLDIEVRRQGSKIAKMVVETGVSRKEQSTGVSKKEQSTEGSPSNDTVDRNIGIQDLTWDDIEKASDQVQPRNRGEEAMKHHIEERNLMLERLRDLHESLASRPPESFVATPPDGLKSVLMPYQQHALAWLQWRETQHPAGGILADDMGLGKTITMIALVLSGKEADTEDCFNERPRRRSSSENLDLVQGRTLVVSPASLMQQWASEVTTHCQPHKLLVNVHHGPKRIQQPWRLVVNDIVITSYNILLLEIQKKGVLSRIHWARVILDEAHIVRNYKGETSQAVAELHAVCRWCVTGTPVQNKDLDLFAFLKFLRCTPFEEFYMWKTWIDNKTQGGQDRLAIIMKCLMLRRTKAQLQQCGQLVCLPSRDLHNIDVTLSKEEMNVYQRMLVFSKNLFGQFLQHRAGTGKEVNQASTSSKRVCAKMQKKMMRLQGAKPVDSHEILVLLLRLRQVCCHCGLIATMLEGQNESGDGAKDSGNVDLLYKLCQLSLEEAADRNTSLFISDEDEPQQGTSVTTAIRSVLSLDNPVFQLSRRSSKIQAVMDCLIKEVLCNKDHKAVVVSQWTSVLQLVKEELDKLNVQSVTLSGQVAVPARLPLVKKLNNPSSRVRVMLLSLCAGGVGLNLCGANHLLLLDPHWNPQLEEQAQDRIYRVGQKRPVHIYRFICLETVEQRIRQLQEVKLQLADNILSGANYDNASKLSIEDLKVLFKSSMESERWEK